MNMVLIETSLYSCSMPYKDSRQWHWGGDYFVGEVFEVSFGGHELFEVSVLLSVPWLADNLYVIAFSLEIEEVSHWLEDDLRILSQYLISAAAVFPVTKVGQAGDLKVKILHFGTHLDD